MYCGLSLSTGFPFRILTSASLGIPLKPPELKLIDFPFLWRLFWVLQRLHVSLMASVGLTMTVKIKQTRSNP